MVWSSGNDDGIYTNTFGTWLYRITTSDTVKQDRQKHKRSNQFAVKGCAAISFQTVLWSKSTIIFDAVCVEKGPF